MMLDDKWSALVGIGGNKVYLNLEDIVLIEEVNVSGSKCCMVVTRFGIKVTVEHTAEDLVSKIEMNASVNQAARDIWRKDLDARCEKLRKIGESAGDEESSK